MTRLLRGALNELVAGTVVGLLVLCISVCALAIAALVVLPLMAMARWM